LGVGLSSLNPSENLEKYKIQPETGRLMGQKNEYAYGLYPPSDDRSRVKQSNQWLKRKGNFIFNKIHVKFWFWQWGLTSSTKRLFPRNLSPKDNEMLL
jgi:hypothetical protein